MQHLSYVESATIGLLQGVSELFPVSSLGHGILVPALVGGSWSRDLSVTAPHSPYLAFIVALHVATAAALIVFFRRDWARVVGGLVASIRHRRIDSPEERLAWLLVLATIPVGLAGVALDHTMRTTLGKPIAASVFLMVNGLVLYAGERLRQRSAAEPVPVSAPVAESDWDPDRPRSHRRSPRPADPHGDPESDLAADRRLAGLSVRNAAIVGAAQIAALAPGISRSGSTMVAGLLRGLSQEDAARFSFLLATPVILAAGVLKIPELTGPDAQGLGGQILLGSVLSGLGAYASVRFLVRYFTTRTLTPFAIYCAVFGFACFVRFAIF